MLRFKRIRTGWKIKIARSLFVNTTCNSAEWFAVMLIVSCCCFMFVNVSLVLSLYKLHVRDPLNKRGRSFVKERERDRKKKWGGSVSEGNADDTKGMESRGKGVWKSWDDTPRYCTVLCIVSAWVALPRCHHHFQLVCNDWMTWCLRLCRGISKTFELCVIE